MPYKRGPKARLFKMAQLVDDYELLADLEKSYRQPVGVTRDKDTPRFNLDTLTPTQCRNKFRFRCAADIRRLIRALQLPQSIRVSFKFNHVKTILVKFLLEHPYPLTRPILATSELASNIPSTVLCVLFSRLQMGVLLTSRLLCAWFLEDWRTHADCLIWRMCLVAVKRPYLKSAMKLCT